MDLRKEYTEALTQRGRAFLATVYDDNQTEEQLQRNQIKFDRTIIKVDGLESEMGEIQDKLAEGENRVNRLKNMIAKSTGIKLAAGSSVTRQAENSSSLSSQEQKKVDRIEKKARLKLRELEKQKEEIERLKRKEEKRVEREERKKRELAEKKLKTERKKRKLVREISTEKIVDLKPVEEKSRITSAKKTMSSKKMAKKQRLEPPPAVVKPPVFDPEPKVVKHTGSKSIKLNEDVIVIHDFNASYLNNFGQKTNTYERPPSSAIFELGVDSRDGENTGVMNLTYTKKNQGGPFNNGGWCGFEEMLEMKIL